MKIFRISLLALFLISCAEKSQVYTPVGGLSQEDLSISQNRAKELNKMERELITEWIKTQDKKFYSTSSNYWSDIEHLEQRNPMKDGEMLSFQYEIFDFDQTKLYDQPKSYQNVVLGKFQELEAVENALRYLQQGEETILLVPSVLAFGTYGDNDKIPHDMPLIIKLKRL